MRQLACCILVLTGCGHDPGLPSPEPDVLIVRDALDATTGILAQRAVGREVPEAAWDSPFQTEGYRRLKERELAMQRPFTDSAFRAFLLSDTLLARLPQLLPAVRLWSEINLGSAAAKQDCSCAGRAMSRPCGSTCNL